MERLTSWQVVAVGRMVVGEEEKEEEIGNKSYSTEAHPQ